MKVMVPSSICGKTHPAGFIETMDFINEQNGAASGIAVLSGALDRFADLFTPEVTAEIRSTSALA